MDRNDLKASLSCNECLLKAMELVRKAKNWTNVNPKNSVKLDIISDLIEQVRMEAK